MINTHTVRTRIPTQNKPAWDMSSSSWRRPCPSWSYFEKTCRVLYVRYTKQQQRAAATAATSGSSRASACLSARRPLHATSTGSSQFVPLFSPQHASPLSGCLVWLLQKSSSPVLYVTMISCDLCKSARGIQGDRQHRTWVERDVKLEQKQMIYDSPLPRES